MPGNKKLFLSAVSSEFATCRNLLAGDLKRPSLDVAVQEDFVVTGGSTLEKLDNYILQCEAVIHLIGHATGCVPEEPAVAKLLGRYPDLGERLPMLAEQLGKSQPGFSHTQWEAYLALYHGRPLFVYRPTDFEFDALQVPREERFFFSPAEAQSQKAHYRRICGLGHDRGQFLNGERLSSAVLRDLVEILPRLETGTRVSPTRLRHTAERLIGRDMDLTRLDAAWNDPHKNVIIVRAFGGVGKTSLVATWMAEMALKNWRGAESVFDWSFYSQGTRDQGAASAEPFIDAALRTYGDPDPTHGSPWERGARLAQLFGKSRCLLVLDGLEPLQYPPGPMQGRLRDQGVEALLKGLAAWNAGLCVVTTREKVDDIKQHYGLTANDIELSFLTDLAGAALLHYVGVRRAGAKQINPDDPELQTASREVRGHGLTLQLLGQYLRLAEEGDIRKRDSVRLADADREYQNDASRPYGHAFKAMEVYEKWFADQGEAGQRQLAVLRLLGLFDRPASRNCLDALRAEPVIAGLSEPLFASEKKWLGLKRICTPIAAKEWNLTLKRLEEINILAIQADGSVDCHPLLREYFSGRLKEKQPKAWSAGHRRLYEHLYTTTKEGDQPTLEALQPLYQAVAHGCRAGLQMEACDKVYNDRITRGKERYVVNKLGAFGSDLGAVACFFETPWCRVSPNLTEANQAWMLSQAAFRLRALGRLTEALEPMRAGLEMGIKQGNWKATVIRAGNLSELELTLGDVAGAMADAEQSVTYADSSGKWDQRMTKRTTHADALHQAGRRVEAEKRFREAEQMQAESHPDYPLLYSLGGFRYCDLLLSATEREAWKAVKSPGVRSRESLFVDVSRFVSERAAQTLDWAVNRFNFGLLTIALDHLTLGRAALYRAILKRTEFRLSSSELSHIDQAVAGLRHAGETTYLPRGLLTRAWLRSLTGPHTGPESAKTDLDEAWAIAERGPMTLFMADIHLHRARLFFREAAYPWGSPQADLKEARRLIEKHGYWRRKEELEDAEAEIKNCLETSMALISDKRTKMKIPNSVIYKVGDVLGSWYFSHTKLNTLFGGNGFPGDPPAGNCIQKCQEWMRRANETDDVDSLELLGLVLVEFMNLDFKDVPKWNDGFRSVTEILTKNGLSFELNGRIVSLPSENSAEQISPNTTIVQSELTNPSQIQPIERAPSSTATNYPVIVLVTVNDNETHALLDAFLGQGKAPVHNTIGGVTYNELGTYGNHRIINTICEMGAGGIGASQQRTRQAIEHWNPRAIIAVGIAFGLDETKQNIGDVLVSKQIQDYELGRLNADGTLTPRGDKPSCADVLLNRLRLTDSTGQRCHRDWPMVRFGLVLSGQKLVDNLDYRESLKALFAEAIGGEMEGTGLYVSASEAKVDWIVVKAICDWGHDKNQADKDVWQRLAAKNAVRVLKSALDVGCLYSIEHAHAGGSHTNSATATFDSTPSPVSGQPALTSEPNALGIWKKKLSFLQAEEAKIADAEQKFSIQQRIEEARVKIQELGGQFQ